MFGWLKSSRQRGFVSSHRSCSGVLIEALEDRRLMSASAAHHVLHASAAHHSTRHANVKHSKSSTSSSTTSSNQSGRVAGTILFSQAPSAAQSGLTSLASSDSQAAPTASQKVYLGNENGVETYSLHYTTSGTTTSITVDVNGNAVTQATQSTTTWAMLDGTGTGSDTVAAAEISAIARALGLTAPTASTVVNVVTTSNGKSTYSVQLSSSSSSSSASSDSHDGEMTISVDASGNPVGRQSIPFSVLPTAIQTAINNTLPSGVTALASTSSQIVDVLTANGVTFYSTTFTTSGTSSTVTVNSSGALATLPSVSTTQFSDLPTAAQNELQTLATADGVSGTISSTQSVTEYNEGNGTIVYSVSLSATDSTTSSTYSITISVDQAGNPTVPPTQRDGIGCGGGADGPDGFSGRVGSLFS